MNSSESRIKPPGVAELSNWDERGPLDPSRLRCGQSRASRGAGRARPVGKSVSGTREGSWKLSWGDQHIGRHQLTLFDFDVVRFGAGLIGSLTSRPRRERVGDVTIMASQRRPAVAWSIAWSPHPSSLIPSPVTQPVTHPTRRHPSPLTFRPPFTWPPAAHADRTSVIWHSSTPFAGHFEAICVVRDAVSRAASPYGIPRP